MSDFCKPTLWRIYTNNKPRDPNVIHKLPQYSRCECFHRFLIREVKKAAENGQTITLISNNFAGEQFAPTSAHLIHSQLKEEWPDDSFCVSEYDDFFTYQIELVKSKQ